MNVIGFGLTVVILSMAASVLAYRSHQTSRPGRLSSLYIEIGRSLIAIGAICAVGIVLVEMWNVARWLYFIPTVLLIVIYGIWAGIRAQTILNRLAHSVVADGSESSAE